MKTKISLILISTFLFFQCKKEEQTSKVEIKEVYFNKILVENEAHIHANDSLNIFAHLVSTEGFSEISVEIHPNFNSHLHSNARVLANSDTLKYFNVSKLSGKDTLFPVFQNFIPATTINGEYHLEIILLDKKGKRQEKIIAFEIENH